MGTGNIVIDQKLLVTGGIEHQSSFRTIRTKEMYLLGLSSKTSLKSMPFERRGHCNVHLNRSHLMVIGGDIYSYKYLSGYRDKRTRSTFLYNLDTNVWTEGKSLTTKRTWLGCSLVNINGKSVIFAVGGYDRNARRKEKYLKSVEFLEMDSPDQGWKRGMIFSKILTQYLASAKAKGTTQEDDST